MGQSLLANMDCRQWRMCLALLSRLKEGDRISLDAERGEIIVQEQAGDCVCDVTHHDAFL